MPIVTVKQRAKPRKVEFDGSVVTLILPTDAQRDAVWRDNFAIGPKGGTPVFNGDGFSRDICKICIKDIAPFPDLDDAEAKFSADRISDISDQMLTRLSNLIGDLGGQLLGGYKQDGEEIWRPVAPLPEAEPEKKGSGDGGAPG